MLEQDVLNRKIIISEPITEELAGVIIERILDINDFDASMSVVSTYEPQPIEMFINSVGGSASAGNAIIGAMELSETPIVSYGFGMVASIALAIYVSADVRMAHRLCRFMYHSVAYGMEGFIQDHEEGIKEARVLQELYDDIILDRTKFKKEFMNKIITAKKDYFFSGVKAVKFGVADELISKPEKKIELLKEEQEQ